eukprot:3598167-Rhodomonas_salina.1
MWGFVLWGSRGFGVEGLGSKVTGSRAQGLGSSWGRGPGGSASRKSAKASIMPGKTIPRRSVLLTSPVLRTE